MRTYLAAILILACTLCSTYAEAQDQKYPSQPIQIIVGFPPGGSADTTARLVGDGLSKELGQPVIVVNKPGAGTSIAAEFVAKAAPDGYTLLLGGSTLVYSPGLLYPKLKSNLADDFSPIGGVVSLPLILITKSDSPYQNLQQVINEAKSKPGRLTYGSTGSGVITQIASEMLNSRAGVSMIHIPFKGTAPMLTSVLSGDIDVAFDLISSSAPMIQSGRVRGLGVAGSKRSKFLPNVPTIAESGLPGFEAVAWYGLVAPPKTAPTITKKLNAALQKVLANPQTQQTFALSGNEVMPGTPESFQVFMNAEKNKWTTAVKQLNIKLD